MPAEWEEELYLSVAVRQISGRRDRTDRQADAEDNDGFCPSPPLPLSSSLFPLQRGGGGNPPPGYGGVIKNYSREPKASSQESDIDMDVAGSRCFGGF